MRGDRLKALRTEMGISQEDLAKAVGVGRPAIANYENGRREPEGIVLVRLAVYLNVSAEYLLGITDDPRRQQDLPPGWEQVLAEAARVHMTPDEVATLIKQVGEFMAKRRQHD